MKLPRQYRYFSKEHKRRKQPTTEHRDSNGLLHCTSGPAVLFEDGGKEWWHHGRVHRTHGPAIIFSRSNMVAVHSVASYFSVAPVRRMHIPKSKLWVQNGLIHRINGPAMTDALGKGVEWWRNGRPHRVDGPAVVHQRMEFWFENGLLHRFDGPAFNTTDTAEWVWKGTPYINSRGVLSRGNLAMAPSDFFLSALVRVDDDLSEKIIGDARVIERIELLVPDIRNILLAKESLGWALTKQHLNGYLTPTPSEISESPTSEIDGNLFLEDDTY